MSDEQLALDAIASKCRDCCDGNRREIEKCGATTCALHPYRLAGVAKIATPEDAPRGLPISISPGSIAGLAAAARDVLSPMLEEMATQACRREDLAAELIDGFADDVDAAVDFDEMHAVVRDMRRVVARLRGVEYGD